MCGHLRCIIEAPRGANLLWIDLDYNPSTDLNGRPVRAMTLRPWLLGEWRALHRFDAKIPVELL
jgi:hypothetical protein